MSTLYLRNTTWDSNRYKLDPSRGAGVQTKIVNTAAGGTDIQWTVSAGGAVIEWCSPSLTEAVNISGTVTINIWAKESNMSANAGGRARLYKVSNDRATWTAIGGPWDDGVEFATGIGVFNWTGSPTSTAFDAGDRIGVRLYITNVGTMGGGYTCTVDHDGATPAEDGDTYISTTETLNFDIKFVGSGSAAASASSALTTPIRLQGSASAAASAASVLRSPLPLSGLASALAAAAAVLFTAITLSGSAFAGATAESALTLPKPLAGSASAASAGTSTLTTAIPLVGTASGSASTSAIVTTAIPLTGSGSGSASASSALTTAIPLVASASGGASADGRLTVISAGIRSLFAYWLGGASGGVVVTLHGAGQSEASASAALATAKPLTGSASASASATAILRVPQPLVGSAAGAASASALLTTQKPLVGSGAGTASGDGILTTAIE